MLSELAVDGNSVTISDTYTFTNITGNHTITATFESAGDEFIKTTSTTFIEGARYIVCYDTNALENNSGSISSSIVSPSNDTITTADETIMWKYSGGKFINDATGTTYYLSATSSAVSLVTSSFSGGSISYTSASKLKIGSYYLRYNSGFVGSSLTYASTITLYVESGLMLGTPTGSAGGVDKINVTVKGTLLPNGGNINYALYVNGTQKVTETGASGSNVTLTATGLTFNTTYSCYVKATSASDSTITAQSSTISVKTYSCDGTGSTCYPPTTYCSTCHGWGTTATPETSNPYCSSCGTYATLEQCVCGAVMKRSCHTSENDVPNGHNKWSNYSLHNTDKCPLCPNCNGAITIEAMVCRHGELEAHSCCIHGYTSPHQ